ncbi:MAG: hypothetical protein AAB444_03120 [Patescibacteria group bacterium]
MARALEWVLRIAVFGEFLGHGVFALQGKQTWIGWIEQLLRVDVPTATTFLTLIGIADVLVAFAVLLWVRVPRVVLLWAAVWGFWTALVRPVVGEPVWDFVERWANWGAPLALLLVRGWPKSGKEWLR